MPRGTLVVSTRWPGELVLVRHGESIGNVAATEAGRRGAERLDLDVRDADTPLSDTGKEQAAAVGAHLKERAEEACPDLIVSSPYRRAAQTAARAVEEWGCGHEVVLDERLRERDLGVFDGLTSAGIRAQYASEATRRSRVGKFYYQPPSGESWCDVTLRVRSLLADIRDSYEDKRVWLFTHQAVIMAFRYVLEHLTEQELLRIDAELDLPNCSLTTYERVEGRLELVSFADATAVEKSPARATSEPSRSREAGDDR